MGWSWEQLQNTPVEIVWELIVWIDDQRHEAALEQAKAAAMKAAGEMQGRR